MPSPEQTDTINYTALIEQYPWTAEKNRKCILSPDSDGFLCALLITNILDWEVAGFYDGKILIVKDGVDYHDCVFLDMEINRSGVGSIGNHLIDYNLRIEIENHNFDQCVQPNMLRGFDGKTAFQRKYPFGAVHLLIGILQEGGFISELPDSAVSSLLFADGVGNNLFGYPENCLDWINYLKINNESHILHKFLCENDLNFYQIMKHLKKFFEIRDQYNATGYFNGRDFVEGGNNKRTGHKIKITNGKGVPINLVRSGSKFSIHETEAERVKGFIREMAEMMGLRYMNEKWNWTDFKLTAFQKGMLSGDAANNSPRLNNQTYKDMFEKNPFSLAMTASNRIEYTLEAEHQTVLLENNE
jgi:hypothetical protein